MNHNYHMAKFAAQERLQKLHNEAHNSRVVQAASQKEKPQFSLLFKQLYHHAAGWKLTTFLTGWRPAQAFRKYILKHS